MPPIHYMFLHCNCLLDLLFISIFYFDIRDGPQSVTSGMACPWPEDKLLNNIAFYNSFIYFALGEGNNILCYDPLTAYGTHRGWSHGSPFHEIVVSIAHTSLISCVYINKSCLCIFTYSSIYNIITLSITNA